MTIWAVIPIRPLGQGKTRLSGALRVDEREALTRTMLAHVVRTVQAARNVDHAFLISSAQPELDMPIALIADPGGGLNAAAGAALSAATRAGADRLVVLHADLPLLDVTDIEHLAGATGDTVVIAPDRHDKGTNAISLPLPAAARFRFAFGQDSLARHRAQAAELMLPSTTLCRPGLSHDVDEPADLSYAAGLLPRHPTSGGHHHAASALPGLRNGHLASHEARPR